MSFRQPASKKSDPRARTAWVRSSFSAQREPCALRLRGRALPGGALDGARLANPFARLAFASACGRSPRRHYAGCVHSREIMVGVV